MIGMWGHGVELGLVEIRRIQSIILLPERQENKAHSHIVAAHSHVYICLHILLLISKHQSLFLPMSYFKSPILYTLLYVKCHALIDCHSYFPYLKVEISKIHKMI